MTAFNTIKPQSAINGICGLWQSDTINTTTPYRGVVLWYARRSVIKVFEVKQVCGSSPPANFVIHSRPIEFRKLSFTEALRSPLPTESLRKYLNLPRHSLSTEKRTAAFPDALALHPTFNEYIKH